MTGTAQNPREFRGTETNAAGLLPRGCKRNAKMKTYFTAIPLLLRLQWPNNNLSATSFESSSRDSVKHYISFRIQELSTIHNSLNVV